MEVASVLCVRTSARASWIPVPTTRRGTVDCVTLNCSRSPWAVRALVGTQQDRDSCGANLVLKAFESDVRAQVTGLTEEVESPPSPKRPRLLDTDSEAEAEDDSQQSHVSTPRKHGSKAPARRVDKVGFTKIQLDGTEFDVGFHKGPGVLFPANASTVNGVLTFLDQKYDVLLVAGRDLHGKRLAARKGGPHELLATVPPSKCRKGAPTTDITPERDTNKTPERDTNKIRFDFNRGAFKICYFYGDAMRRSSKGFEVPRTDALGLILGRTDYAKVKAGVLHKARMAWNRLDQSDAARFQDQSSSDVVEACSLDGGLQPATGEGL